MTRGPAQPGGYVAICVDGDAATCGSLRNEVAEICGPLIDVRACTDGEQALALLDRLSASGVRAPLVITEQALPGMSGVDLLLALRDRPESHATRKVVASSRVTVEDLTRALDQGALHRVLPRPWTAESLRVCVRSLVTGYFTRHAPEEVDRLGDVIDTDQFPRAFTHTRQERQTLVSQIASLKLSFLANIGMNDEQVQRAMVAEIDDALGTPARREHAAGTVLLRQDEPVDTLSILLDGQVQLSHSTGAREIAVHTQSDGGVIGLVALAHGHRAFYTWRATSDITVIPLSLEQLETALQAEPMLSGYIVSTLIRTIGERSKRTAGLLLEVGQLNVQLRDERNQLAGTLRELEESQTQLVESQKMATLGQLCAGVAHELNNPVAAIQRAADFLREDLVAILGELPDGDRIKTCMLSAMTSEPLSTRQLRERRATLAKAVGGDDMAQRLVKAGITTLERYREMFGRLTGKKRDRLLDSLARYHQIGRSLRNTSTCSERITAIVKSLRAYTRGDQSPVAGIDLHEGIEGTLLMFGPALRGIEVVKEFGDTPEIECRVGEINQVWTNVISNALQAMDGEGVLRIETDAPKPGRVRVRITDSGPGVPPESLARVFELNFTTKKAKTGFGLGMGLTICKQIIARHGGTIEMTSKPGRTCVSVTLPVRPPQLSDEGRSP